MPVVLFGLEEGKLVNATPKCRNYFDKIIGKQKLSLKDGDMLGFRNGTIKDKFRAEKVRGQILSIAFSYLYTERDVEARKVFDEMWPPADRERIWNWMIERRAQGILKQINSSLK